MKKITFLLFTAQIAFAFDLPDPLKEYVKDKGMEAIDLAIVEGVDDRIKDVLDLEGWGRDPKIDIDGAEGSKDPLDEQIDRFLDEYNGSEKPADEKFGSADPLLLAQKETPSPILSPSTVELKNPGIHTDIDYIEGATRSASGILMHDAIKKIAGRSAYAYLISLETVSPLTTSAMKQIQTWANQLNAMSIQSNDIASFLNPAGLPKRERANTYLYEHALASSDSDIDLIEARRIRLDKKNKPLFDNAHLGNLFAGSYDVAEQILSLTDYSDEKKKILKEMAGTIIVEEKKGSKITETHPPRYKETVDLLLSTDRKNICGLLRSIQKKLMADEELAEPEAKILRSTHFPLGHLITLLTQYKGSGSEAALDRYAEIISMERVLRFIDEAASDLLRKAKAMNGVQVNGFELQAYIEQLEEVLVGIEKMKEDHHRKRVEEQQAMESMLRLERAIQEKEKPL
jgi:conjugative transfer pilus assembly protein TraH